MAARFFITLAICFHLSACVTGGVDAVDPSNSDSGGRVHIQSVEQAENGALSVVYKIVNDTQASICLYEHQGKFSYEFMTADLKWSIFDAYDPGVPDYFFGGKRYVNPVVVRIQPGASRIKRLVVKPLYEAVIGADGRVVGPVPDRQAAVMRMGISIGDCVYATSGDAFDVGGSRTVFSEFQDISRYGEGLWRRGGSQVGE